MSSVIEGAVLVAIRDKLAATGCSPTMRELAERVDVSAGTVHRSVKHLVKMGKLARVGSARSSRIRPIDIPNGGLNAAELAWCQANPGRVKAMMQVAGTLE